MFPNIKWLRITPDRAGRGGIKTGIHTFQQTPVNDVRNLSGVQIYRGMWQRSYNSVAQSNSFDPGSFNCSAIHGYVYPSLTDPAAAPGVTLLGHTINVPNNHIWDFTNNAARYNRATSNQAAVFLNVNQRCIAADGTNEAMLMDDRTPAIHAQKNQTLGIGTPQQPMPLTAGISYSTLGTAYSTANSKFINSPNPNNLIYSILTTDTVGVAHVNAGLVGYSLFGSPASGVVDVAGKTSNNGTFTAAGTISITTGTSVVTLSGSTWPANGEYCGLAINFNGYSFVVAETLNSGGSYDINGNAAILTNTTLLILGVYDGPTLTNVPYTITGSQFKLHAASSALTLTTGPSGYGQSTISNLVQCLVFATRANGFYRNLGNISLGPVGGGVPDTITDGQIVSGFLQLYSATGPWVQADIGKTIVIDHAGNAGGTAMLVSTISAITGTLAGGAGNTFATTTAPSQNAGTLTNTRAWWVSNAIGTNDATMAAGTAVLTSASNPFTPGDVGKEIIVATAGAGGPPADALFGTIITFTNSGSVTLSVNCNGAGVAGVQAYWGGALSNTHTGPTYAYAWYDPETGHMSNISPLFTVPRPTTQGSYPDFANLSMVFDIDPGKIAYPSGYNYLTSTGDAIRFSHIVFFRTLSTPGSSTLYPIGSLVPFTGKVHPGSASTRGSWNPGQLSGWMGLPNSWVIPGAAASQQWYDFSSDSDLLLSGGFRAPQFTNSKPMALLRGGATQPAYPYLEAYWDRRLWLISTQEPDKLLFSCDEAQCPLGVPEESFPPTNFLRLPSVDGKGVGLRVVGEMLLVTTNRMAYTVVGNNESNYRLMKLSSSMPGVGTYQMDEFPTYAGTEGEPTTLFFLGMDWKVYQWTIGGAVTPISAEIQNTLDSFRTIGLDYYAVRIHSISTAGRRQVVLSIGQPQAQFFIFDVDNRTWTTEYVSSTVAQAVSTGAVPMTTIYGSTPLVNEIYAVGADTGSPYVLRSWVRQDGGVVGGINPLYIQTFPINFDGKKTRKQIVSVNLHATVGTYTLDVYPNEAQTPAIAQFGSYPDPIDSIYSPVPSPLDPNALDIVVMAGQFNTDGAPLVCYRCVFQINRTDNAAANVFALDIGYIDMENPGEGDA